jgi:hypothetical protein
MYLTKKFWLEYDYFLLVTRMIITFDVIDMFTIW